MQYNFFGGESRNCTFLVRLIFDFYSNSFILEYFQIIAFFSDECCLKLFGGHPIALATATAHAPAQHWMAASRLLCSWADGPSFEAVVLTLAGKFK